MTKEQKREKFVPYFMTENFTMLPILRPAFIPNKTCMDVCMYVSIRICKTQIVRNITNISKL